MSTERRIIGEDAASTEQVPGIPASGDVVPSALPTEIGGRGGLDPTRFGDWEKNGRCIDF